MILRISNLKFRILNPEWQIKNPEYQILTNFSANQIDLMKLQEIIKTRLILID